MENRPANFSKETGAHGKEELVSVIMALYNEPPKIVAEAIGSILSQSYEALELLIYDDSTDQDTQSAIDAFSLDPRVQIHRYEERVGFVKSLNLGLEAAKGKYIARMDGDDISRPERLRREVDYLEAHGDVCVVGGQIELIDDEGKQISFRRYPNGGPKLALFSAFRSPLAHPTVMMRRELVDAGFRYDENLSMSEDLDLWLRIMNRGYRIANLDDVVLDYRIDSNFEQKRTRREQLECVAGVRRKNFAVRYPLRSSLSWMTAWLFLHGSVDVLRFMYNRENRNQQYKQKEAR